MENLNQLHELYNSLIKLPVSIREQICHACDRSVPTFYRKIKAAENLEPSASQAEAEKILYIFRKAYKDQLNKIE